MIIRNQTLRFLMAIVFLLTILPLSRDATSAPNAGEPITNSSKAALQQPADKDEGSEWAQCESYCNPYKPGTSVAEIRWRVAPQPLGARELAARTAAEVIEVSVYKDGFERGLYAHVSPVGGARRFALINKLPAQRQMPGLDRLILVDVATSPQKNKKGFRMLTMDPAGGGGEWAVAKVEGLEPGLIYFWRVQSNSRNASAAAEKVVSCQAATCPVDSRPRTRTR